MLIVTLMIGIACGQAAELPDGQCKPPHTQFAVADNYTDAARDLNTCSVAQAELYKQIIQKGQVFDTLLYCEQKEVGTQR